MPGEDAGYATRNKRCLPRSTHSANNQKGQRRYRREMLFLSGCEVLCGAFSPPRWCSGLARRPFKPEITGSNPVRGTNRQSSEPFDSSWTSVCLNAE